MNVCFPPVKEYLHPEDSDFVSDTLEKHGSYRTQTYCPFCMHVCMHCKGTLVIYGIIPGVVNRQVSGQRLCRRSKEK